MSGDPRVIAEFRRALRDSGAGPKVSKALFEAGLVESNLRNLNYGDRDSKGPLQQRPSQGWKHPRNSYRAALAFIAAAQPIAHKYKTAGELAQAVQRSAFPARYGMRAAEADALRRGLPAGRTITTTTPAKTTQNIDGAIIAALSEHHAGNKLAGAVLNKLAYNPKYAPKTTPAKTTTTTFGAKKHVPDHHDGVSQFDGKPVAGWIAAELRWARAHGWKGTVTSGYRSYAAQKRIYDSGVRPAAKPGTSNHEGTKFPLGAVDVTDAQQLAQILKQRGSPLKWAGAKDPVHFSHPHGGGY